MKHSTKLLVFKTMSQKLEMKAAFMGCCWYHLVLVRLYLSEHPQPPIAINIYSHQSSSTVDCTHTSLMRTGNVCIVSAK